MEDKINHNLLKTKIIEKLWLDHNIVHIYIYNMYTYTKIIGNIYECN